jgi:hypothetical protein
MKVEDVPEEWVQAAWEAWALTQDDAAGICMKHMLAAVIPAIRAAEREQVARWHDEQAAEEDALAELALGAPGDATDYLLHRQLAREHINAAAAIRALKETT